MKELGEVATCEDRQTCKRVFSKPGQKLCLAWICRMNSHNEGRKQELFDVKGSSGLWFWGGPLKMHFCLHDGCESVFHGRSLSGSPFVHHSYPRSEWQCGVINTASLDPYI